MKPKKSQKKSGLLRRIVLISKKSGLRGREEDAEDGMKTKILIWTLISHFSGVLGAFSIYSICGWRVVMGVMLLIASNAIWEAVSEAKQ